MKTNTYRLVLTSLFIALTFLLGLTPIGIIPLGFINVTILCIPVIIGTIIMGLKTGLLLGACFGVASTLRAFGIPSPASGLVSTLMAASPAFVVIMSMLPRIMVPVFTHAFYTLVAKKSRLGALPAASVAGSLANTILYLGLMLLFYLLAGLDATAILALIAGTGLIAGSLEAVAAALIVSPIVVALWKVKHIAQE